MSTQCICKGAGLVSTLRQDIDRFVVAFERDGQRPAAAVPRLALSPRIWAIVNHRLSHFTATRVRWRIIRGVLTVIGFLVQRLVRNASGIQIDPLAHIGPGLFFPHEGYIVVGAVRIGKNCTISQGVTLGRGEQGDAPENPDIPLVGDRVWIGPGAVIAGRLQIGSDAVIGANSVALRDVPPRGVAFGVPARVISHSGSFAKVHYRDMVHDPARSAALAAAGPVPRQDCRAVEPAMPPTGSGPQES